MDRIKSCNILWLNACAFLLLSMICGPLWGEDHDLVMTSAPDISSTDPDLQKSPDIKIGADFGDASVPDVIRRGRENPVYPRFLINGVQDHTVPSGGAKIRLHYRAAAVGDIPPDLTDPSWVEITASPLAPLSATYEPSDGPFAITRIWPTDFPSVSNRYINWLAPPGPDEFYQVRAEVYYDGIAVTDEHPNDNVAISLYQSLPGLLDIVLLHDTSGSMGYYMYAGDTYLQQAIARASFFVSALEEVDQLGVVAFESGYPGGTQDIWHTPIIPLQPASPANKIDAASAISGLSDGQATPLGLGIQRAIQVLTAVSNPDRKKVIVLLSDGYENNGTPRACPPSYPTGTCLGGPLLGQLQANNIRVYAIGLGTAAWADCLQCLAEQSGGRWYAIPDPGITMADIYLQIQQDATADDLYRIDRGISGGGGDTYTLDFEGLGNSLYVMLAWDNLAAKLGLQLRPPNGAWVSSGRLPGAKVFKGKGYEVVRIANPAQGTWEYRSSGQEGENYLAAVRSAQVGLRLHADIDSQRVAGKPLTIKARVTDRGKVVQNAKLLASVQLPAQLSLSSRLRQVSRNYILKHHKLPVDQAMLQAKPDASAQALFVNNMTNGKPETFLQTRTLEFPLKHVGNGLYTAVLTDTNIAGNYTITVRHADKGQYRTQSRTVRIQPGVVDYRKSFAELVSVAAVGQQGAWLLRTYPSDQYGNAIAVPDIADQMQAKLENAQLEQKAQIVFDSAFQQPVVVAPGKTPQLKFMKIGDREISIKEPVADDEDEHKYHLGVVLVVLLLALLAL